MGPSKRRDVPAPKGDEAELFARHAKELERIVQRTLKLPPELTEEACSFAWLQLLRYQPERERIVPWLRVVATHEAFRLAGVRSRLMWTELAEALPDDAGTEPARSEAGALVLAALAATAAMPERRRQIFGLHVAGYTYEEIAERTGESRRAIDRQIGKARKKLRQQFGR